MSNLNIDLLKKGDVFSTFDGDRHRDLEFIRADKDSVFANKNGKEIVFDRVSVEINGELTPREMEGEYAVGEPMLEDRRAINLKLLKKTYKDIDKDSYFLYFRRDRTTSLHIVMPIDEGIIRDIENGDDLETEIYIVEDVEFCKNETMVVSLCNYKS